MIGRDALLDEILALLHCITRFDNQTSTASVLRDDIRSHHVESLCYDAFGRLDGTNRTQSGAANWVAYYAR